MERQSLRNAAGASISSKSNIPTDSQFKEIKFAALKTHLAATFSINQMNAFRLSVGNTSYGFDQRFKEELDQLLTKSSFSLQQKTEFYQQFSLWDLLVINGAIFEAETAVTTILNEEVTSLFTQAVSCSNQAEQKALFQQGEQLKQANDEFLAELRQMAVECYIRPKLQAVQKSPEDGLNFTFHHAINVFAACESELKAGKVAEKDIPTVNKFIDETAKGVAAVGGEGTFDLDNYLDTVDNLSSNNILKGLGLLFAGVVVAAVAIATAHFTLGSSLLLLVGSAKLLAAGLAALGLVTFAPFLASSIPFFAKGENAIAKTGYDFAEQLKTRKGGNIPTSPSFDGDVTLEPKYIPVKR